MNLNDIILNENQREIYTLKQQGLKYKEIAEKVGLSASTVSLYHKRAEHIVMLTEWHQFKMAEFDELTDITLTKGDVRIILDALLLFERAQLRRKEQTPINNFQAEYLRRRDDAFKKLKKKALICTMGEKKYQMIPEEYK